MRKVLAILALGLTTAAKAEVTDRSPAGFEIRHEATIAAPPDQVHVTLLTPARWWNGAHTYSGDAANLSIDVASGCFCERLPKGIVRHMTVIYSDGSRLVLQGALGPLASTGATGHLAVEVTAAGAGTRVVLTYAVGGYAKGGLAERWAAPVDGVLGEQLARLKRAAETGG